MDFARKQLEKYGWTDGKGLGKNENGISEALKPKLKRSVTGIGYDAAADITDHWWSALYDKAAKNVQVEEKNGKTKKMKTVDNEFEITNSMWRLKRKMDNDDTEEYSEFFVRNAVLGSGGSKTTKVKDSDSEDDTDRRDALKLTDEDLFAACEGRTAHKGARHGLRALGKLARIEQQEKQLLQQEKYNTFKANKKSIDRDQVVEDTSLFEDAEVSKKKKKKKKRCNSNRSETNDVTNECNDNHINDNVDNEFNERINESVDVVKKDLKKKKKSKKNEIESKNEVSSDIETESLKCDNKSNNECNYVKEDSKKKKKKSKKIDIESEMEVSSNDGTDLKCKKKRKHSAVDGEAEVNTDVQIENLSKKKKKKKIDD